VRGPLASLRPMATETRKFDIIDGSFYVDDPYGSYAWLRENAPAYWDDSNELWAITRYDDIVEIEKRKDVFVNSDKEKGGYRPNLPADDAIIGLDDPLHNKRRNLVSRRFTPRAVNAWADDIRGKVTALIDGVEAKGGRAEVIDDLAAPLPAMMIGKLLGFPEDAWRDLQRYSEMTIQLGGGPRYMDQAGVEAAVEFFGRSAALFEEKKGCPMDDVMSVWTTATIDGKPISLEEVASDCLLLLDGGAETTRTVIARTICNLVEHPDQWAALKAGVDMEVATEELIRFVTPIHNMCRVAKTDFDIGGETIRAGQQVVLMYASANRDPAHFTDPERFDVTRTPNHHISFGFGTHFCLGAALARIEIRTFFEEFVRRVRSVRLAPGTTPVEMPNAFVYGLREAHVEIEFE
jgi:cytochrome P450 family 142 subfamily A polypeptide 1